MTEVIPTPKKKPKVSAKGKKLKGSKWERDAAKLLAGIIPGSIWKRIAGSGAIGTIMGEPLLAGDISGYIPSLDLKIRAEAKTGYGGEKQLGVKREWLNKIREEAGGTYSLPLLLCKFSGVRTGAKHMVILDFEAFGELFDKIQKLADSEQALLEEVERLKNDGQQSTPAMGNYPETLSE